MYQRHMDLQRMYQQHMDMQRMYQQHMDTQSMDLQRMYLQHMDMDLDRMNPQSQPGDYFQGQDVYRVVHQVHQEGMPACHIYDIISICFG